MAKIKWANVRVPRELKDEVLRFVSENPKWMSMANFNKIAIEEKLQRERECEKWEKEEED